MSLQKQSVNITNGQGMDLKTDPWQIPLGKMANLQNVIFTKGKRYEKRNGFALLQTLPNTASTGLTTYKDNLVASGTTLNILSESINQWFNRGVLEPISISVNPLLRNNTTQVAVDTAVSASGLACTVYTTSAGIAYYQVNDAQTGQIIISPISLPSTATTPRVFVLGNNFVITFLATVSSQTNLQYVTVPIFSPESPGTVTSLSSQVSSLTAGYDGIIANNNLYLAFDGSDSGHAVRITFLDSTLVQHNTVAIATYVGSKITIAADTTGFPTPVLYITFWNSGTTNAYTAVLSQILVTIHAPTLILSTIVINSFTSYAASSLMTLYYETVNAYSYSNTLSNYISSITITQGGTVGTAVILLRSVGLASKAFSILSTGKVYFLVVYNGAYQPTYFVTDQLGNLIAKLAYANAGGYMQTQVLPSVSVYNDIFYVGYLFKDEVVPVNKSQGVAAVAGIYNPLGINLATLNISDDEISIVEIANALHLSGGFVWFYDGVIPVEFSFHIWPEDVLVTTATPSVTPTGTTVNGSTTISALSSLTNVNAGATITGTGIPSGTIIISVNSTASTIVISQAATANGTGITLTIVGAVGASIQYYYYVTYEWTDASGNIHRSAPSIPYSITTGGSASTNTLKIPTLRLTYKNSQNPVRIVIYRWSVNQQVPYQVTSVINPLLNNPTVDFVTFADAYSDASILGNIILYTTGGIVENVAPPACSVLSLYKSRLFVIPSEDPNNLWYSKQILEDTPVETSDLFTLYTAPTVSSQASTGPNFALMPMDDKNIISKQNAFYYFTGTGPDNTGANNDFSDPIFITTSVGSVNQNSFVMTPQGLMFQSQGKGIWILMRNLECNYIGAEMEAYNNNNVTSAILVPGTNEVRFTLDNGITVFYDYYFGQWGTFTNVKAVSSCLYQDLHSYLDSSGNVYQETPGLYVDGSRPVLMSLTTGWINLAGLQGFQRAYFFYLIGQFLSPHKIAVEIAYDYESYFSQSFTIIPDNFYNPYGVDPIYGDGSPYGGGSLLEQWRIIFNRQKIESFQVQLTEIYDSSQGVPPGGGFYLSGLMAVIGIKKGYPTLKPSRTIG